MRHTILGRTGARVSVIGMGGAHAGICGAPEDEYEAIIHRALDLGVNFIDSAFDYGAGEGDRRFGTVIKTRRDDAFLVTKVLDRTADGAARQLETSLSRLNTDHVEVLYLHGLHTMEELDRVTGPGGALEVLVRAREEGVTRFLGVSNHARPNVLVETMRRFDFDVGYYPTGPLDYQPTDFMDGAFVPQVTGILDEKNRGKVGMKITGHGLIAAEFGDECLRFGLSEPIHVQVVGIDSMELLEHLDRLVDEMTPMNGEEKHALIAKVKDYNKPEQIWWRADRIPEEIRAWSRGEG